MSSFYLTVRHKGTGKLYEALDDAFGRHVYGYTLGSHHLHMREDEFFLHYERVEGVE